MSSAAHVGLAGMIGWRVNTVVARDIAEPTAETLAWVEVAAAAERNVERGAAEPASVAMEPPQKPAEVRAERPRSQPRDRNPRRRRTRRPTSPLRDDAPREVDPTSSSGPQDLAEAPADPVAGTAAAESPAANQADGVAVAGAGDSAAVGSAGGEGLGPGKGGLPADRPTGPPHLRLTLSLPRISQQVLVRPATGLLMAVPGYRSLLRGSGVTPFVDLTTLQLRLPGLDGEGLALAAQHLEGEQALVAAAERVAAMRGQEALWREGSGLRASSWVDGTGVDRGLAIAEGAFLIAPRQRMARLLGEERPAARLRRSVHPRRRVLLELVIEDVAHYLPELRECGPAALQLSLATVGGSRGQAPDPERGGFLSMTVHYERPQQARQAAQCLVPLASSSSPLRVLYAWVASAQPQPATMGATASSASRRLTRPVARDDVAVLMDGLAWALRSAARGR